MVVEGGKTGQGIITEGVAIGVTERAGTKSNWDKRSRDNNGNRRININLNHSWFRKSVKRFVSIIKEDLKQVGFLFSLRFVPKV